MFWPDLITCIEYNFSPSCLFRVRYPNKRKYCATGVEVPESVIKFNLKRGAAAQRRGKNKGNVGIDPVEMAREKFQIAAKAGCDLGFKWLARLEEEEKRLLTEGH